MNLESYIQVYDHVIPPETIGSFIKYSIRQKFDDLGIGEENTIDKNVRNVQGHSLTDWNSGSKTKIHWCNYLASGFKYYFKKYSDEFAPKWGTCTVGISTLDLLKYEEGGFYTPHVDNFLKSPRILSGILLLNDDYEGGELEFFNPTTEKMCLKVEVQSGRLIVWPSCFLYPHSVKPVKKGKRYSVVAWAS